MYYLMRASAPSLHRESTDSLILSGRYVSFSQFTDQNLSSDT